MREASYLYAELVQVRWHACMAWCGSWLPCMASVLPGSLGAAVAAPALATSLPDRSMRWTLGPSNPAHRPSLPIPRLGTPSHPMQMGAAMRFIDCGGGLAVDYDGSFTDSHASMSYTLQHYANDGGLWSDCAGCGRAAVGSGHCAVLRVVEHTSP